MSILQAREASDDAENSSSDAEQIQDPDVAADGQPGHAEAGSTSPTGHSDPSAGTVPVDVAEGGQEIHLSKLEDGGAEDKRNVKRKRPVSLVAESLLALANDVIKSPTAAPPASRKNQPKPADTPVEPVPKRAKRIAGKAFSSPFALLCCLFSFASCVHLQTVQSPHLPALQSQVQQHL